MSDQSNKADGGKSNPLLLLRDLSKPLLVVNRVLDYGAEKYEQRGWMKVEPERYESALLRHHRDIMLGEFADRESGLSHRAHLACNALFLLHFEIEKNRGYNFTSYNKPPQTHKEQAPLNDPKLRYGVDYTIINGERVALHDDFLG